jgi:hypothetical protein
MSIEVTCAGCQRRYRVPEGAAGKKLRCKGCGALIVVEAVVRDPFDDADPLSALEPAPAPAEAAPYLPPSQSAGVASGTIKLIFGAAGGAAAIVAIVIAIAHFTSAKPEAKGEASVRKNVAPVNAIVTVEGRLGEIWNLYSQYAASHDGHFPATLQDAGHPELSHGNGFDLVIHNLALCRSPLPAKLVVAAGVGEPDASGHRATIMLFGDGQIKTLNNDIREKARQESADAETDALLWLASDATEPKGAEISWFVALGMGDAVALKARSWNVDEELLEALAVQRGASREFMIAAATQFRPPKDAEPRAPKTETDLAREMIRIIRNQPENVSGETATIGPPPSLELKKIDGLWRLDPSPIFDRPSPVQCRLGAAILQINARAAREVAGEIVQGKYADWPAARQALLDRMRSLATADAPFQELARANRGVGLPKFAMIDPLVVQKNPAVTGAVPPAPRTLIAPAPVARVAPAPAVESARAAPAAAAPDTTPILPDAKDQPEPRRSEVVGGNGGGPVQSPSPNGSPVIGFRHALGRWANHGVLRRFEPIFQGGVEKAAPDPKTRTVLARDGYVVGGLLVDYDDTSVIAVRVIFLRKKGDQLDPNEQYRSEWIGTPAGKHQKQLAGKGELIIGTFGRQGLNVDALGVLMPSNLQKTALVGGHGGGPFTMTGNGESPVAGLRCSMGHWNGPVIGHLQPLYHPAGNDPPAPGMDRSTARNVLAKDGYVVGGLVADFDEVNLFAFRVIFVRRRDGRLDPKDRYTTDWIGTPSNKHQQQLAGEGEEIIGIFGRQGMNCDAIGLIEKRPQSHDGAKQTPR